MRFSPRTIVPGRSVAALLGLALVVGSAWRADARPKDPKPAASPAAIVDINSGSEKDLEGLNGIGAATAKKIIAGRPYATVEDLAKVGVSASTIAKIKPYVTVGAAPAAPATASAAAVAPPAPAPAAPAKPAKAPKPTPVASATTAAPATPPQPGMVWANTSTKVFHREGDRYYGNTKHGKWMTEEDAVKAGYHEAQTGGTPKAPGN